MSMEISPWVLWREAIQHHETDRTGSGAGVVLQDY